MKTLYTILILFFALTNSYALTVQGVTLTADIPAYEQEILGIGDSKVHGAQSSDDNGYRTYLYSDLGGEFRFVGKWGTEPACTTNDAYCRSCGVSGQTADEIDTLYASGCLRAIQTSNPERIIILIDVGTNDVAEVGFSATDSVNSIKSIITKVQNRLSTAEIYVAQQIPRDGYDTEIDALNTLIVSELTGYDNGPGDGVTAVIDMQDGWVNGTHRDADGVHPNDAGYEFISDKYLEAINAN